jgi:hypothetical protein
VNYPPTSTLTLQCSITGDGRNDVVNVTPVGLPLSVNQFTNPITCFTFAIFEQIGIGLNADDLQTEVVIPPATRYMILRRTDGTPLNMTWQQASGDVGLQLHKTASVPLVWALPLVNPPTSTYFTISSYVTLPVLCDVYFIG